MELGHGHRMPFALRERGIFYGWIIVGVAMLATFASGPGHAHNRAEKVLGFAALHGVR